MKIIVQRSKEASVNVNGELINKIDKGLVLLVGFTHTDTVEDINYLVKKVINLKKN